MLSLRRTALDTFRDLQLRRLVRHAHARVPYYRRLFDRAKLRPDAIRGVADLARLPITTRRDLQALPASEVVAQGVDPERLIVRRTSGWSGTPLHIRRTWFEERLLNALRWRVRRHYGVGLRDRVTNVGLVRPRHANDQVRSEGWLQALGLCRSRMVDCCLPGEELVRQIGAHPLDVLISTPAVLGRLAPELARNALQPRLIFSGGEVLTRDVRRRIQGSLSGTLREFYGAHEFNLIAWQCPTADAYHVCDEGVIVEVLRGDQPAQPGERGEVVITGLHSFAMPLLRYRLGDVVTQGSPQCGCGLPYPTIQAIQGRMLDYFILPDGRWLHPYQLVTPLLNHAPWIRQYQLEQARRDLVRLRAVPERPPSSEEQARLREALTPILGPGTELRLELADELALEASGKFRPSRSLVHSDYDAIDWEREAGLPSRAA